MAEQELSVNDIKNLTKTQSQIEARASELRRAVQERENEENSRHNVALGEIKKWYHEQVALLNEDIKALNASSAGLMPVHPRR